MNYELKFVDTLEIKCKVLNKYICEISEDEYISIVTNVGVLISKLYVLKDNNLPIFSYNKQFIKPSQYVLAANLEINLDSFVASLKQFDLYESILRSDTSACIYNCAKKSFSSVATKWSPMGLMGMQCVIAVLNDAGSLDLYTRIVETTGLATFTHLVNVSNQGILRYNHLWKDAYDPTSQYMELKRRIQIHTPTAFVWSHLFTNGDTIYCLLLVSNLNGKITIWKFNYVNVEDFKDAKIEFLYDFDTKITNITAMHWKESDCGGLLIIGNEEGNCTAYALTNIGQTMVDVSEPIKLCTDEDCKVDYIHSSLWKNKLYIYVFKQCYIIMYLINQNGNVIDNCVFCVGNLHITGFQQLLENKLLVLTHSGVLKELSVSEKDDKICVDWRHIYVNINWNLKKALGFFTSSNYLIFTFLTDACKIVDLKEKKSFQYSTFINKTIDPVKIIIKNSSNSLADYTDCFEVIRVNGILNKQLICDELPNDTNYDELNLTQLKTYLNIAKISEFVYDQIETVNNYNIKSANEIQTMIEIKLAVYYIQIILKELEDNEYISAFKSKCLKHLIYFLKEVVMQDLIVKYNLGKNCIDEIFDVLSRTNHMDLSVALPCMLCGNGSTCLNKHFDNRCALTLIQIVSPKYRCPQCKRYVSEEAIQDFYVLCCPFCDESLDIIIGQMKSTELIETNECNEDCLENQAIEVS